MTALLDDLFDALIDRLPRVPGEDDLVLDDALLPDPPAALATRSLVVTRGYHFWDEHLRRDLLQFYAPPAIYRRLGLLLFKALLSERFRRIAIALTHPETQIRELAIDFDPRRGLLVSQPQSYRLWASAVERRFAPLHGAEPADAPSFQLGFADGQWSPDPQRWEGRDRVVVTGSDQALAHLGDLLVNLGAPHTTLGELNLEHPPVGGVRCDSAEASFWLPGGADWRPEFFP